MNAPGPLRVLVVYSGRDEPWKARVVGHLRVLGLRVDEWDLDVAHDRHGVHSGLHTKEAILEPEIVIPLISPNLFSFGRATQADQLKAWFEQRRALSKRVMPVILAPGAWERVSWLASARTWPRAGRSLADLSEPEVDAELAGLVREISNLVTNGAALPAERQTLTISHVWLEGVRRLANMDLPVLADSGEPRRCTVFIGRNRTCKTTLLRSLALALCDDTDTTSLLAEPIGRFLAVGAERGGIRVELRSLKGNVLTIDKQIHDAGGKDAIKTAGALESLPFVCAYGAGRFGTGEDPPGVYRTRYSVFTLFDYRQPLHGLELTLRRLEDFMGTQRYEATRTGLARVLGLTSADLPRPAPGGGLELWDPAIGHKVPFVAWADGYRLTFTWLLDFYAWAFKAGRIAADGHVDGILLVDEPEQHLHPSMQAAILPRLKEALPRVQLFVTTHSPLVALGAQPGEVVRLREEGVHVVAEPAAFDFSGYSAEDMLVDGRLFDTIPYAPETTSKLERYRALVAIRLEERTPAQTEELRGLARELRSQQLPEVRGGEATPERRTLIEKHPH